MPYAAGVFSLAAGNPVVTGTIVSSTWANNTLSDIATGLSTAVLKDGTQVTTAPIPHAQGLSVGGGSTLSTYIDGQSWTPGISFGGGASGITYAAQTGKYLQIGKMIVAGYNIVLTAKGSGSVSGLARITGLPATSNTSVEFTGPVDWATTATTMMFMQIATEPNTTNAIVKGNSTVVSSLAGLDNTNFTNTTQLQGSIVYHTT